MHTAHAIRLAGKEKCKIDTFRNEVDIERNTVYSGIGIGRGFIERSLCLCT